MKIFIAAMKKIHSIVKTCRSYSDQIACFWNFEEEKLADLRMEHKILVNLR